MAPDSYDRSEIILGRLLERSETGLAWLHRIDQRLKEGDARMGEMCERIAKLETSKATDPMPVIERWVKVALPYLIAGGVLAITGKLDLALQALSALGAK